MKDTEFSWQVFWETLQHPEQWSQYQWGVMGLIVLVLLLCIPVFRWSLKTIKESMNRPTYKPNLRREKPNPKLNKFR